MVVVKTTLRTITVFVEGMSKPQCLVCLQIVSVPKECNLKRHYETRHKSQYSPFSIIRPSFIWHSIICSLGQKILYDIIISVIFMKFCSSLVNCHYNQTKLLRLEQNHWNRTAGMMFCSFTSYYCSRQSRLSKKP